MKKIYMSPATEVLEYLAEEMIAASGVSGVLEDIEIEYGGVDEDGEYIPADR